LDPILTKQQISDEEVDKIFLLHKKFGNKWAEIARELPGRSDNCIKNFYYSTFRKYRRNI
jgi:Myb-like DNA-binding protein FlbD